MEKKVRKSRKDVIDRLAKKKQGEIVIVNADEEYKKIVEEIYGYLKEGMRSNEIYASLILRDKDLSESKFAKLLEGALQYADIAIHRDRDYMFQLHMNRYENIYYKSVGLVDNWNRQLNKDNHSHWQTIVVKYMQALEALEHKEKLLGLHDKKVVMEFNDQGATIIDNPNMRGATEGLVGYDFSKLSLEEKIELLSLVKECRTVPIDGIQRLTLKKTVIEINPDTGERKVGEEIKTIDIGHEVIPNVVSRMKNVKEIEPEVEIEVDPIIDSRPNPLPAPRSVGDIGKAINKAVMDEFKKKLKEGKKK